MRELEIFLFYVKFDILISEFGINKKLFKISHLNYKHLKKTTKF